MFLLLQTISAIVFLFCFAFQDLKKQELKPKTIYAGAIIAPLIALLFGEILLSIIVAGIVLATMIILQKLKIVFQGDTIILPLTFLILPNLFIFFISLVTASILVSLSKQKRVPFLWYFLFPFVIFSTLMFIY